jgi:hypothetical protein
MHAVPPARLPGPAARPPACLPARLFCMVSCSACGARTWLGGTGRPWRAPVAEHHAADYRARTRSLLPRPPAEAQAQALASGQGQAYANALAQASANAGFNNCLQPALSSAQVGPRSAARRLARREWLAARGARRRPASPGLLLRSSQARALEWAPPRACSWFLRPAARRAAGLCFRHRRLRLGLRLAAPLAARPPLPTCSGMSGGGAHDPRGRPHAGPGRAARPGAPLTARP